MPPKRKSIFFCEEEMERPSQAPAEPAEPVEHNPNGPGTYNHPHPLDPPLMLLAMKFDIGDEIRNSNPNEPKSVLYRGMQRRRIYNIRRRQWNVCHTQCMECGTVEPNVEWTNCTREPIFHTHGGAHPACVDKFLSVEESSVAVNLEDFEQLTQETKE